MKKEKPIVGIIAHREIRNGREYGGIYYNYIEAIKQSGGVPILIPPLLDADDQDQLLTLIDGILIPGGGDVHPKFYQEPISRKCGAIDQELDEFEIHFIQRARERGCPLFGICRGMQVLNVAFGGSLYQDIEYYPRLDDRITHAQDRHRIPEHLPVHPVKIQVGSRIFEALDQEDVMVNSFHHQLIKDIAPGFVAVAASPDGIVEGIESTEDPLIIGVQWHPEKMYKQDPLQRKLFDFFIDYLDVRKQFNLRG